MSTLVIVESPAKAKTIEKYLGKGYVVKSSIGHVRDLPKSNKDALDIPAGFVPKYINSAGKQKVIAELKAAARKSDKVLLAADPDREGEAIAWHVAELIKDDNSNLERITFNEITESAVQEAILHPRAIDMNLKAAQEARRVLDRLVGYDLSGIIWKKVRYGLSAGRVQSPALRIIMEREREIRAFIPEEFFILTAHTEHFLRAAHSPVILSDSKGATSSDSSIKSCIPFVCVKEPNERTEAERIETLAKKHDWHITGVKETEAKRAPYAPFTTSTLQQTASTRLGFSPSRTMSTAQKLYQAGHITYMRTDSPNLSVGAQKQILAILHQEFGAEYVQPRNYKAKGKNAQEAHEGVRPTNSSKEIAGNSQDERDLYNLIRIRALASQMKEARIQRTKILANITGSSEEIPDFAVNGSRIIFDGWLRLDKRARGEDVEVPQVSEGDELTLSKFETLSKFTEPPNRYTEAGLIKELEKRGIGRPSTYASIMQTLADREYVVKQGKTLMPTDTGDVVSSFLEEHFPTYISDTFTSKMEEELDEIADGKRDYVTTLSEFYTPFSKAVASKEDLEKATNLGNAPAEFPCPTCGKPMVIKLGKAGKFLSCGDYPNCMGARMLDGSLVTGDVPIGTHPETGENIYLLTGRFGPYVQQGEMPEMPKGRSKEALEAKKNLKMPRRASLPKNKKVGDVTLDDALHYLVLPRELGKHPETGEPILANTGQFGPYIAYNGEFRSLKPKAGDEPYTITLERAIEILATPKPGRKGEAVVKELGKHPKTGKPINVLESKSGMFLRRGFKRISLPAKATLEEFTLEDALILLTPPTKKKKK